MKTRFTAVDGMLTILLLVGTMFLYTQQQKLRWLQQEAAAQDRFIQRLEMIVGLPTAAESHEPEVVRHIPTRPMLVNHDIWPPRKRQPESFEHLAAAE